MIGIPEQPSRAFLYVRCMRISASAANALRIHSLPLANSSLERDLVSMVYSAVLSR